MEWLQNVTVDLLNKIDKNAAEVLNDSTSNSREIQSKPDPQLEVNKIGKSISAVTKDQSPETEIHSVELSKPDSDTDSKPLHIDLDISNTNEWSDSSIHGTDFEENVDKSEASDRLSSSSSMTNSMILAEEVVRLQNQVDYLTRENHQLGKELLNNQHQYSELSNDATNLRYQIENLSKQLSEAEKEKNIYIARAQRILQEKEKSLTLQQNSLAVEQQDDIYPDLNEELRKELETERQRYEEISKKNSALINDMQSLQMQHKAIQNQHQASINSLTLELENERRLRNYSDEANMEQNKAIVIKDQEYACLQKSLEQKDEEIKKLQEQLHKNLDTTIGDDVDNKIKSLTHTLMTKQHNLETITTERNALRLQLEKMQSEHQRMLSQVNISQDKTILIEEREDSVPMPRFMRVSPFDASVTRRVKRAYSTLDAVSIRTGVFLRRYPVARVFVFCYMVLLQIWVLIILFLYAPSNH